MSRVLVLVGALAIAPGPGNAPDGKPPLSPAQQRVAAGLRDRALAGTRAAELAASLSDEAGPRMAGSEGDRRAVAWALRVSRELGLSNVRAEKVPIKVWIRGEESGELVAPVRQPLALTALGGSVPTPEGGLEADVIEVDSFEALEDLGKEAVSGRIVFFNRRMRRTPDGSGYGEAVPFRSRGASRAAALGAVGVLIRSVGTDSNRTPHTGSVRYAETAPRIPAAALSNPDADMLERIARSRRDEMLRVSMRLGCRDGGAGESANVLAEIPGRRMPGEIVLLACHLDSWDLGTGAVDDAAGCAIVLEAARAIAQLPPESRPARTIRVVLFANEEHGLAGGREYARAHEAELDRHVAAIEADAGTGAPTGFSWNAGAGAARAVEAISRLLKPMGAGGRTPGGTGGADISRLVPAGVPVFGLRQDMSRYFDLHHTANDTADKLEPESLNRCVAATAVFAFVAADGEPPFERIPEAGRKPPTF